MSHILIIGAGGVSQAATVKCAMNSEIFTKITLASRTKSKCDKIAIIYKRSFKCDRKYSSDRR